MLTQSMDLHRGDCLLRSGTKPKDIRYISHKCPSCSPLISRYCKPSLRLPQTLSLKFISAQTAPRALQSCSITSPSIIIAGSKHYHGFARRLVWYPGLLKAQYPGRQEPAVHNVRRHKVESERGFWAELKDVQRKGGLPPGMSERTRRDGGASER